MNRCMRWLCDVGQCDLELCLVVLLNVSLFLVLYFFIKDGYSFLHTFFHKVIARQRAIFTSLLICLVPHICRAPTSPSILVYICVQLAGAIGSRHAGIDTGGKPGISPPPKKITYQVEKNKIFI